MVDLWVSVAVENLVMSSSALILWEFHQFVLAIEAFLKVSLGLIVNFSLGGFRFANREYYARKCLS